MKEKKMIEYDLSDTTVVFDNLEATDHSTDSNRQPNPDPFETHYRDNRPQTEIKAGTSVEELTYYP